MSIINSPDFLNLPAELRALFAQSAQESFFSSAGWYDLMARFGLETSRRVRLYCGTGKVCQAALVCQTAAERDGVLRGLTNAYSCEHRIIISPDADRIGVLRGLAASICGESPAWDRVILAGLDPADPTYGIFAETLRTHGMAVQPFFDSGTWYEETGGLSFARYIAERPSVLRNTWRRKAGKADRSGELRFTFYNSLKGLEQGIADYEAVYGTSWKPDEAFPRFMPALMRMAAEMGALRLGTLQIANHIAASQFWIVWRGKACIYKLAHDQRFDNYSPGTLLTMRMMELVLEQDRPFEVNFGRGDDPYKKLWLPKRRERWGLAAANFRTLPGFGHAVRQTLARIVRPLRRGKPRPPI